MKDDKRHDLPDPLDLAAAVMNVSAQAQRMMTENLKAGEMSTPADPLGILPALKSFLSWLAAHPDKVVDAQFAAFDAYMRAWQHAAAQWIGTELPVPAEARGADRRFKSSDWQSNPFFGFVQQIYLLTTGALTDMVESADELDSKDKAKLEFYLKQYLDALSPTNFILTNPEVLRETVGTGGRNLIDGLQNLLADIDPKTGRLKTTMVDKSAFKLGENVASSPGKVIFQNELMQLIQYAPATEEVNSRPLLIIPPWINKFYILDLQEKNSLIRHLVNTGHTVFIISWVNPDSSLAEKDFVDYMIEGPLAAMDAIQQATGEAELNVIGYCLGGTLLGATLAYLAAKGDRRIVSATFFTALLDFSEPGDLGVFIDEAQLENLDAMMAEQGYLDGNEMATTFNMLRANDLIWSFVVNNYLMGRSPMAFDLLFWNSDSTRMPARMHSTYLRKMYLENQLKEPGGIEMNGVPIDLRSVEIPICFVSAIEDHIAPWRSTFTGAQIFPGEVKFILSQAGHIAGIVNPPGDRQYGHFTGPAPRDHDADTWLAQAEHSALSWWDVWDQWIAPQGGKAVGARTPGDGNLDVLEDAPGSYVRG